MKKILILLLLSAIVCSGCSQQDGYSADDSLNTEASVADENTEEGLATEPPLMNTATDLSEAEIGDNVIFNESSCDKYKAYIQISNLQVIPEEKDGLYEANGISVILEDTSGSTRWFTVPCDGMAAPGGVGVYGYAFDEPPKFFEMTNDEGESEYILFQEGSSPKGRPFEELPDDVRGGIMLVCDTALGEDGEIMPHYHFSGIQKVNGVEIRGNTSLAVSDSFTYVGDNTFTDYELGYSVKFDPEKFTAEVFLTDETAV